MTNRPLRYVPALLLTGSVAAVALANGACNAVQSLTENCSQFPGEVASLMLGGDAQAFVQAGADLVNTASSMETAVLSSCIGIATDLGATDTWTSMAPAAGSPPDAEVTAACNQASAAITAILQGDAGAQASCGLSVSGGQCTVSASAEASCEGQCNASGSCTPPDVTVACKPGELSVQCSGTCNATATCEGSVTAAATCQGSCEAECSGECDATATAPKVQCNGTCSGTCYGTCAGTATPAGGMASCAGTCSGECDAKCTLTGASAEVHCSGTCNGQCTGNCTVTATGGVSCGANVSCKGGCTGTATAPKCEGQITPPTCNASADCQASCKSHASLTADCPPPTVSLECAGSASTELPKLQATLTKYMPAIISVVQTQGPLAYAAAEDMVNTGSSVASDLGNASAQALACARVAVSAATGAATSIHASVMASVTVSASADGPPPPPSM